MKSTIIFRIIRAISKILTATAQNEFDFIYFFIRVTVVEILTCFHLKHTQKKHESVDAVDCLSQKVINSASLVEEIFRI